MIKRTANGTVLISKANVANNGVIEKTTKRNTNMERSIMMMTLNVLKTIVMTVKSIIRRITANTKK